MHRLHVCSMRREGLRLLLQMGNVLSRSYADLLNDTVVGLSMLGLELSSSWLRVVELLSNFLVLLLLRVLLLLLIEKLLMSLHTPIILRSSLIPRCQIIRLRCSGLLVLSV